MTFDGIIVEHSTLGEGKILRIESKGIWVQFSSDEKLFSLENSLGKHLFIRDKENEHFVKDAIKSTIEEKSKEEEEKKYLRRQPDPDSYLAEYIKKKRVIRKMKRDSENKRDREEIQNEKRIIGQIIIDRQIKNLVHFTRIENLASILKYGLVPVSLQEKLGIRSVKNDNDRLEDRKNCTSCSVEFPNYQMFYKYRMNNSDSKWVVLVIDIEILIVDFRINYFSYTNAARAHHKGNRKNHWFRSPEEFENMFSQPRTLYAQNSFSREQQSIPDNMPTDPQAEILISEIIDPQYIKRVCFNNQDDLSKYLIRKEIVDEMSRFCYDPSFFKPRKDYTFWKKENKNGT